MALAPARHALYAPFTVIMPLTINGMGVFSMMACSSFSVFRPAGGTIPFKKGKPAASTSMATAKAPASLTISNFSR